MCLGWLSLEPLTIGVLALISSSHSGSEISSGMSASISFLGGIEICHVTDPSVSILFGSSHVNLLRFVGPQ